MRVHHAVAVLSVLFGSILSFAAPLVTSVSPDNGPSGTQVQINGTGFGTSQGASTVSFSPYSQNASVVSWSDTQITATVPASATTGAVRVTVGGVLSNTTVYFTVPVPQVNSISPTAGVVGTQVTVNGSGFQATKGSSSVYVGGAQATVVTWSDTQIVGTVTSGATTGPVSAFVNGTSSNQDVVFTMPNPYITGVSPSSGPIGTQVTISGSGFGATQGSSTITFTTIVNASVVSWSNSQLVVTVPASATSGPVTVKVGGVASNTNVNFRVPTPLITSILPTSGVVNTQVTINGSGFQTTQGYSSIAIGAQATVVSWSDTQIVGRVQSGASTGRVLATVNGSTSNQDIVFTMPNPTIVGVSPTSGPVGSQVQINGSGFGATQGSSTLYFYSSIAASVTSWSDTQIIATVPVGSTSGNVRVTVGGVNSNTNINFTVPGPVVTSVSPSSGVIGTQVTVNGSGFGSTKGTSILYFGGYAGNVVSWGSTQIVATVPSGATTGAVSVTVSAVVSNRDFVFTLPNPAITSLSPTGGPVGTQVTANGSGFGTTQGSSTVKISGLNAPVSSWSDTQIVASVPSGASSGSFQVTVGGVNSNAVPFAVGNVVVTDVSPKAGPIGSQVTVTGVGFGATRGSGTVSFNNVAATSVSSWNNTQIVATVPTATSGAVKVVQGSTSNTDVTFTVGAVAVNSVTPASGPAGVQVQINGGGFGTSQGSSTVTFNGYTATASTWLSTQITVTVPSGATTGPVRVTVGGVSSNATVNYTVVAPIVTSISPTTGPVGTQVQVNGNGFGATQGTSTLRFNGTNASIISWSNTQITATVPAPGTTSAYAQVTVAGVGSNTNVYFTIPSSRITGVSPSSGVVGTQFTITGSGFGATKGSSAVYMNGGYGYTSPTVTSWSDTQIVGTVPAGTLTGPIWVNLSGVGSSNTDVVFSMPNPKVATLSPSSGPVGTQVAINGSGFGATQGSSTITFSGTATTVSSWSDSQIIATVPTGVPNSSYILVTVGGVASNSNTYFTVPAPRITSLSPSSGVVGTQITVSGSAFGSTQGSSSLLMGAPSGYSHPSIVNWSDTQIVATVPAGAIAGPVLVSTSAGNSNSDVLFTMPNPRVASLVPGSGPVSTQVAVNGSGFGNSQGSSSIAFNFQPATVVSWSDTQIVAAVPTGAASGPVTVTVGGVNSNNNIRFTVPPPHITSISPVLAGAGRTVTISGTGFQPTKGSSYVGFNGYYAIAPIVSWSDTQIVGTVPAAVNTGPGPVYVTVNSVSSNPANFTVPANAITSVSPSTGPVGTSVTVSGSGFGSTQGTSTIKFNGQPAASVTSWTATSIVATVPNTASTGPVEVSVNGIGSNINVIYTVPPPQITSVAPQGGAPGTQVTVNGSDFQPTQRDSTIAFNGTGATVVSWSNTQIVATVPSGASTGPVTVSVNAVPSNTNITFTVPNPIITTLAPPQGAPGGSVILQGSGFGPTPGNAQASFYGTGASIQSWSDTAVTLQVPTGATSGPVTVTTWGVTSNSIPFTVIAAPAVASISPISGYVDSHVTIDGTGFGSTQSNSTVDFNGTLAGIFSWSDTQIVAIVPPNMLSGPVNVTVAALNAQGPSFFLDRVVEVRDSNNNLTVYNTQMVGGAWRASLVDGPGCSSCSERGNQSNTYDWNGNLLTHTDANSHTTSYTYDGYNNMLSQTMHLDDGTPVTTSYTYNSFGEVLTMTDPLGHVTTNTYDAQGNLLTVTSPAPDGQTSASVTQFGYDTKGELTSITDPLTHGTSLTYYPNGLIQSITDTQNHVTTYGYDTRGNRTSVIDPINGSAHPTTFAYDAMNRLTGITYPDNTTVSFGYDSRGRRTSATDQNNKTTTYVYDDADRLVSVTDAATNVTAYAYDSENNLSSITDANNHTTYFAYDAFGRVTQTTFPSTLAETYAYDAMGNLLSKTDRKNQTIQYVYDALNRLTSKVYPDSTAANYVYDLVGKIQQVSDPTGTYGFAYDNMGRLIGTTTQYSFLPGHNFQNAYTYDAASNRASLTAPDGSTNTYAYDTLNRLSTLTNSLTGQFGFGYDALSRRTQLTRPNGINTNYTYDSLSRLLSVLHQAGSTTLDGASYGYDYAGNRTSKTNYLNGVTEGYGYDLIYQLTQVTQGASTTESYSYDAVGNRLSSLGVNPYSYNASNQLTATPSGSYTYDANGNTLSDASGRSFTWDFENRLTQAVVPNVGTTTFRYDPFGRRIQKSGPLGTTNFLYDGFNVIEEADGSGNVLARYSQGLDTDEPLSMLRSGATSYFQTDDLRSTTSLSSAAGSVAKTYTYDALGNVTASTGTLTNPFQFTSREVDSETGLEFYRARYYDPSIGRFISEDPIRFDGGFDFYVYVENNPALYIDPMGLVHYNKKPPDTVPVTGATAAALNCLEHCLQCLTNNHSLDLLVSGGAEQTGHSKNSYHYMGMAVDISYWNNLQTSDVFRCAENCGFEAGGDEPKKHHWHLQLTPGNGSRALPMVYAPIPDQCKNCGNSAPPPTP